MADWITDKGTLIYENPLAREEDLRDFRLEGRAKISFPAGRMLLENAESADLGQKANYVLWCEKDFPAMIFFSAAGRNGEDLFSPSLAARTGEYVQYHHGDINAFHLSFFRRKEKDERSFHTCNLRKSYGLHMAAQGADPIPDAADADGPYTLSLLRRGPEVRFAVNGLEVLSFLDDGKTYGPLLGGGKIGLRQLAPMAGEYADLRVWKGTCI